MYYIKTIIFISMATLLLGGCTSSTQINPDIQQNKLGDNPKNTIKKPPADDLNTLYQTAIHALKNNRLDSAKETFLKITKIEPELAGAWANLALIEIKQKRYKQAEQNIKIALDKNPEMAQALNLAGSIEEKKGNINSAKSYYEKAIITKPGYALAHYNLALLYDVYLQDIIQAVTHYQLYLALLDSEDRATKSWVEELKFSIESRNR